LCHIKVKGFTLIELLVFLLVLSIIFTIAKPGFEVMLEQARVRAILRELVTDVRYAQQMALGEGKIYYVIFDRNSEAYRIQVAGNPFPQVLKQVFFADGIDLSWTSFPEDRFHFTSLGAPSGGGTVTIMDSRGNVYRITVLPATGRVRIYYD